MSKKNLLGIILLLIFIPLLIYVEKNNEDKNNSAENIEEKAIATSSKEWFSLYGGGFGLDSVIKTEKGPAIRISTKANGGWFGAGASFPPENLENEAISFYFLVQDWSKIQRFSLILASDAEFKNSAVFNVNNYFAKPEKGEWIRVAVEKSYFEPAEGKIDWSKVSQAAFRVIPVEGMSTKVWVSGLDFIEKEKKEAVISLTFDDGFSSNMPMAEMMKGYGFLGTAFVIPDFIGQENYLTEEEINKISALGWEIGGHGKTDLTSLPATDVDTDLAATFSFLEKNKYKGRQNYAYPNGAYDRFVKSQVLEYFTSARTIDGFSQPMIKATFSQINAFTISSSTPVSEVVSMIDSAKEDGSWLILVWHDFVSDPKLDTEYRPDDFKFLLDYIQKNNIEVLPYGEVLERDFAGKI